MSSHQNSSALSTKIGTTKSNFSSSSPIFDYVAGATAGAANVATGYPFDTIKVRMQANICSYSNSWQCFTSIVRNEGARSLFRGLSSPLIGGAIETGINYAVYEASFQRLRLRVGEPLAIPIAAATAGFFLSFVVSPAELIKCRMQLGAADVLHTYAGPMDCIKQVIKSEGLRGVFRGLGGTMAREMPGNAVYFGTYKSFREILRAQGISVNGQQNQSNNSVPPTSDLWITIVNSSSAILCGALSGMLMWAVVLPIDVAKTRIQTAWPSTPRDVGLIQQLKDVYKEGGRRALYAGLGPTLLRAAPANAAQWLTWEIALNEYDKWKERKQQN